MGDIERILARLEEGTSIHMGCRPSIIGAQGREINASFVAFDNFNSVVLYQSVNFNSCLSLVQSKS